MSTSFLQDLVLSLDSEEINFEDRLKEGSYGSILKEIEYHAEERYCQFTPMFAESPKFTDWLTTWLRNQGVTDEGRKILLQLIPYLQFIDRDDLLALYRTAFTGPITRWFLDEMSLDFSREDNYLNSKLQEAKDTTWFCTITDSMDIAQFHHVNNLAGKHLRPSWKILNNLGSIDKIKEYMQSNCLKRLVILEDFVGTGTQSLGPLRFVTKQFCPDIPVLFVPLIISEIGLSRLKSSLDTTQGFRMEPSAVIPCHIHVQASAQPNEPEFFSKVREIIDDTFDAVKLPFPPETEPLIDKFGFGSLGTLFVLYTNCPNNTPPFIWHRAPQWAPLFPRVSRA